MAKEMLSDAALRGPRAKPKAKEFLLSDGGGLYLRVKPSGSRTWMFIYKNSQRQNRRMTLGDLSDHTLSSARAWASGLRAKLDNGVDPQADRDAQQRELDTKQNKTLGALLEAYVKALVARGAQSATKVQSDLSRHIPTALQQKTATEVTRDDLMLPLRKLQTAGKGRTANKIRAYLVAAFNAALSAPDNPKANAALLGFGLTNNPAERIAVDQSANRAGERSLNRMDLAEYQRRIANLHNPDVRDLLRLCLLLGGQRMEQMARAELSQDIEGNPIVVMMDTKGRRQQPRRHVIPIQGEALNIVQARGNKLFGLDTKMASSFCSGVSSRVSAISKAMLAEGLISEGFRAGDIRRTCETHLAAQGVDDGKLARLLSHGLGGVQAKHYNRHDYLVENRIILQRWETYLASL